MESPISGQLRALVVDDQRDSIYLLGKHLERLGCDVTPCQVASECVDHARRTSPHLILIDIAMPAKNGFVVAEELLTADLPRFFLVALSGYGGTTIIKCCDAAGFDKHVLKPAGIDQLQELVHSARQLAAITYDAAAASR